MPTAEGEGSREGSSELFSPGGIQDWGGLFFYRCLQTERPGAPEGQSPRQSGVTWLGQGLEVVVVGARMHRPS